MFVNFVQRDFLELKFLTEVQALLIGLKGGKSFKISSDIHKKVVHSIVLALLRRRNLFRCFL